MARVLVVIVTFNSAAEIGGCLDALAGLEDTEIVVVDNASSDGTVHEVTRRGIRLIANTTNAGFAAAVNQGCRAGDAPLILLLNPDAHLRCGLDALIAEFDDPSTGAAGGMLTDETGKPQTGFMARNLPSPAVLTFEVLGINRVWPGNPVNWPYRCLGNPAETRCRVEQPAGAFLMYSRQAYEKTGGFDERFHPVWFEDVDFCARLKVAGYRVYYNPAAVAKHTGGHSVGILGVEVRELYWYGSLLEYASKHYRAVAYRAVCTAVFSGAVIRAIRGVVNCEWQAFEVYGRVCRLAASRLFGRRRRSQSELLLY